MTTMVTIHSADFFNRRTKKKDIYVISTAQRPVPLEHYIYAGREIYRIVDSKRNFISQGLESASSSVMYSDACDEGIRMPEKLYAVDKTKKERMQGFHPFSVWVPEDQLQTNKGREVSVVRGVEVVFLREEAIPELFIPARTRIYTSTF